jgi:hypothetical protein
MQQSMLDEVSRSYEFYHWNASNYRTIKNNFYPRKGDVPGTRTEYRTCASGIPDLPDELFLARQYSRA